MSPQAAAYLETRDVPLADLTPFPGNARSHDLATIRASLQAHGQYRPLVVRQLDDGSLVVLAGNGTLEALHEHGPGPCPAPGCSVCRNTPWAPAARCEIHRCDDDTATRINLVDNRSSELGGYDEQALAALLTPFGEDLAATGYTTTDVDDLLKSTGALGEATTAFLADFIAPATAASPPPPPPGTAPPPAAQPFSAPAAQPPPGPGTPASHPDPSTAAAPHTGPAAYTGPGAPQPAGQGPELPQQPPMATVQWVVTEQQRDIIRTALKQARDRHTLDTAADAVTHICQHYLDTPAS